MADELSSDVPQTEYKKFEDKLILLYLINKMDLPLSNNQITMFAVADNKMELFVVQQNLSEMTQSGHLEKFQNNNATRYSITEEGANVLEYFEKQIPQETRNKINKYVTELAARFHRFYAACHIRGEEEALLLARLKLADSVRIVIGICLKILGVAAPVKM